MINIYYICDSINAINDIDIMKSNNAKGTIKGAIENGTRNKFRIPKNVPSHVVELSMIIHFNHGIRRHTALNILNYFIQKGVIDSQSDKDRYVDFSDWNKFAVVINGLKREYSYREQFFIDALVGAFKSFAEDSQKTIENFIKEENRIINGEVDDTDEPVEETDSNNNKA